MAFNLAACSKKEPGKADATKVAAETHQPVDTLKDVAVETGNPNAIGGTRWAYFDGKIADGTMQASAQIHASDDRFEDLSALLVIACQSTGQASVWVESDDVEPSTKTVTYKVDGNAPVESPATLRAGRSLVFGGPSLVTALFAARTVSVNYPAMGASKGELYFVVSGLNDLKAKLLKTCPNAGL